MITTETRDDLRVVTLDRPEKRNALTREGLDELETVLTSAEQPVVYLTGAGEAFCAGADLDVVASLDRKDAVEFARHGQRVARALAEYDGVVVAGIDGAARGGGVELALACDIRVATPAATLAESGVSLGLFGAWGGTARLPRIVGEGEAMDLALSGRALDATEAKRIGLVSRVTPTPPAVAGNLADTDPTALRRIKQLLRNDDSQSEQERQEANAFGELIDKFDPGRVEKS